MTPLTPKSPLSRLGSFSFGKSRLEAADQAELEIMTENLRSSPSLLTASPSSKKAFSELHPDDFHLQDGEARSYLDPACLKEPAVKEVLDSLLFWLNQFLAESRVRLTSLEEDLKDGMVLKLVLEKLTGQKIELPCGDFVQSRERQATNLEYVLQRIREKTKASLPWKAESILSGDLYAVVSILVIMVCHFQEEEALPALPDLPKAVKVTLLKLVMRNGTLQYEKQAVNLMGRDEPGKRDGFDTLIDHAPEKLHFVKQSLVKFANVHLSPLGWEVTSLETDFSDGVRLILLTGCLEGYFVPLYLYNLKPTTTEEKMENMNYAFRMIEDAGLPRPRNRPSEIVHNDLKATLRIVYSLFIKYKVV